MVIWRTSRDPRRDAVGGCVARVRCWRRTNESCTRNLPKQRETFAYVATCDRMFAVSVVVEPTTGAPFRRKKSLWNGVPRSLYTVTPAPQLVTLLTSPRPS